MSMILAIACANTHTTVAALGSNGEVKKAFRIATNKYETNFGYASKIKQSFELLEIDVKSFEGAVLSCVIPSATAALKEAVRILTGKEPLTVGAGIKTGIHIKIDDPGSVASDLVCAAIAAKEEYPLPCIVIDMGTATTFTVVDDLGRYVGGSILPGVKLSLDALSEGAALLPDIDIIPPEKAIAKNTVDCMKSGIVFGTAGAIDAMIERIENELGTRSAAIIATGTFAPLIIPYCKKQIISDEYLIMKGLYSIYIKNKTKTNC